MTLKTTVRVTFLFSLAALVGHLQFSSSGPAEAHSQETPTSVSESPIEKQTAEGYRRTGAQIPMYAVVDHFFDVLAIRRQAGEKNWARMMRTLDVATDSEAEKALRTALAQAQPVQKRTTDLTPYRDESPELFRQVQLRAIRWKVHELSRIYYRMCDKMEGDGVSTAALEEYLEKKIRTSMTMVSFPTADDDLFEIMAEFEAVGDER